MKIYALHSSISNAYRSLKNFETKVAKNGNISAQGAKTPLVEPKEMKPEEANYLRYGGSLEEILKNNPTKTFTQALEEVASPMEMMMYRLGPYKYISTPFTKI